MIVTELLVSSTASAAPAVPTLSSPANGATLGAGTTSVSLVWNPVSGVYGYNLAVGTSCGSTSVAGWSQSAASSLVPGLSGGQTYYWRVQSVGASGTSSFSSCRSFSVAATPPPAPTLNSPANGATLSAGTTSVSLVWNPVSGVYGYNLAVGTSCGSTSVAGWSQSAASSLVPGLSGGQSYYWRVQSVGAGGTSSFSSCRSFSVAVTPPSAPTLNSPSNGAVLGAGSTSVTLIWNSVSGVYGYNFEVYTGGCGGSVFTGGSTPSTNTSFGLNGLSGGQSYYWRVQSVGAGGTSSFSSCRSFSVAVTPPSAPTLSSPSNGAILGAGSTSVTLVWNSVSGVYGYNFEVYTGGCGGSVFTGGSTPNTTFGLNGLSGGQTYHWRVQSVGAGGTSPFSSCRSFSRESAPPTGVPTPVSPPNESRLYLSAAKMSATLEWTPVDFVIGYSLDVYTGNCGGTVFAHHKIVPTAHSWPLGNLENGTRYYWRVRSVTALGMSESSCSSFIVAANPPSLKLTKDTGTPVKAGDISLAVLATDPDENLSFVDINWNDGTPVERWPVVGGQSDLTVTRAFDAGQVITWSITAYDTTGDASRMVTGTFGVAKADGSMPNEVRGSAFRYRLNGLLEGTPIFLRRMNDERGIDPTARTWMPIHGRNASLDAMAEITRGLTASRKGDATRRDDQILALDWSAASDGFLYSEGEAWIQPVGEWAAKALSSYGFVGSRLNLVGHSWGTYVAAQIAGVMPYEPGPSPRVKVNSIVALDPAKDDPVGPFHPSWVHFGEVSNCSWAFHSSFFGSKTTPVTASEAFAVVYDDPNGPGLFGKHSQVKEMFAYMITNSSAMSNLFKLDRLALCEAGPWVLDGFNSDGNREESGGYEGRIGVRDAALKSSGALFLDYDPALGTVVPQYRLHHDGTKEHLYTADQNEYNVLGTRGWTQEGGAHNLLTSGLFNGVATIPLFRLYHPGISQHHWTTDANEASTLADTGAWTYEGVVAYVAPTQAPGTTPLYRMALASPPLHLWTTDLNEYNTLATRGWVKEGIIGYVVP
jgi:pimeloyl-ACP methyl ester carboxylesterase